MSTAGDFKDGIDYEVIGQVPAGSVVTARGLNEAVELKYRLGRPLTEQEMRDVLALNAPQ